MKKILITEGQYRELMEDKDGLDIDSMYSWYGSFEGRYFKNVDAAKAEVIRVIDRSNNQFGRIFSKIDPEKIVGLYNYIETKKGIKIEPKLKQKAEKKPDLEYNTNKDLVNKQEYLWSNNRGIEIGRFISKLKYINTNDSRIYGTEKTDMKNVSNIMQKLKNGEDLPPILLDYDFGILDGHHRWEAAKKMKIKKIPVIIYEYPEMEKPT